MLLTISWFFTTCPFIRNHLRYTHIKIIFPKHCDLADSTKSDSNWDNQLAPLASSEMLLISVFASIDSYVHWKMTFLPVPSGRWHDVSHLLPGVLFTQQRLRMTLTAAHSMGNVSRWAIPYSRSRWNLTCCKPRLAKSKSFFQILLE